MNTPRYLLTIVLAAALPAGVHASESPTVDKPVVSLKRANRLEQRPTPVSRTKTLAILKSAARRAHTENATVQRTRTRQLLRLDLARSPMFDKISDLEALPLLKVRDNDSHRVYFGIGFDGVVGLHGNF